MFWDPCDSLGLGWVDGGGGGGDWVGVGGGGWGVSLYMCTCMYTCVHTCIRGKDDNFMQMAASIGFLGNPWEFPIMSYTCMHVHMWLGHFPTTPTHIQPPPTPMRGPLESVKIQ